MNESKKYSKLIFIRRCNPIYEDFISKYSTIRFYSETIVNLAARLGITEIEIPYFDETYPSDEGKGIDIKAWNWYNSPESDSSDDLPTIRLRNSAKAHGISINIHSIYDEVDSTDALVVLSFMTEYEDLLSKQFNERIVPIVDCAGSYIYLSSDNEYSGYAYKKDDRIWTVLEFIGEKMPESFQKKMKCIIMTESNCAGLRDKLNKKFDCAVLYMPMIIDKNDIRFDNAPDFAEKEPTVVMLKNMNTFKGYLNFFNAIRGHGVIFESSMPAIQKRYRPLFEEYGFVYKFARFWKMPLFENKIRPYKIFIGLSNIGSSRFTSKILEGTNAGCITISPRIDLESVGFSMQEYPITIQTLNDSGIMDVLTPDCDSEELCDISFANACSYWLNCTEEEYTDRLNAQRLFILDYFTIDSPVIEECMSKVINVLTDNVPAYNSAV